MLSTRNIVLRNKFYLARKPILSHHYEDTESNSIDAQLHRRVRCRAGCPCLSIVSLGVIPTIGHSPSSGALCSGRVSSWPTNHPNTDRALPVGAGSCTDRYHFCLRCSSAVESSGESYREISVQGGRYPRGKYLRHIATLCSSPSHLVVMAGAHSAHWQMPLQCQVAWERRGEQGVTQQSPRPTLWLHPTNRGVSGSCGGPAGRLSGEPPLCSS